MYRASVLIGCFYTGLYLLPSAHTQAHIVEVRLISNTHIPLADIVVVLSSPEKILRAPTGTTSEMLQQDRSFKPKLLVIQAGTQVNFPNKDPIKHHVYSFSKAKNFQLRLYRDKTPKPVAFDTPGIVALGCNIHDWMLAYIYVTDTPYYANSNDDGIAVLEVPEGNYRLHYWHPLLNPKDLGTSKLIDIQHSLSTQIKMKYRTLKPINPSHFGSSWGDY